MSDFIDDNSLSEEEEEPVHVRGARWSRRRRRWWTRYRIQRSSPYPLMMTQINKGKGQKQKKNKKLSTSTLKSYICINFEHFLLSYLLLHVLSTSTLIVNIFCYLIYLTSRGRQDKKDCRGTHSQ